MVFSVEKTMKTTIIRLLYGVCRVKNRLSVDFLRFYTRLLGSLCGLQGIKIHESEFLYGFALKRNKPLDQGIGAGRWFSICL
jgi:hypothetical protein